MLNLPAEMVRATTHRCSHTELVSCTLTGHGSPTKPIRKRHTNIPDPFQTLLQLKISEDRGPKVGYTRPVHMYNAEQVLDCVVQETDLLML